MLKNLGLCYLTTKSCYQQLSALPAIRNCRNEWVEKYDETVTIEPELIVLELPYPGRDTTTVLQTLQDRYPGVGLLVLVPAGQEKLANVVLEMGEGDYLMMDPAGNYQQLFEGLIKRVSGRATPEKRQQANQLAALRQVGLEMAAQLNLDSLLQSIVSKALKLLNGDAGGLYLYDPQKNMLEWRVALGADLAPLGSQLQPGEGVSGMVMKSGQAILLDDYEIWENKAAIYTAYHWVALVAVPVKLGQEFLGVLNILSNTPAKFNQSDLELLTLFANQVAIAIYNANLFNQEREQRLLSQQLYHKAELELQERKLAEVALQASQERFRAAIAASLDIFFILEAVYDPAGTVTQFNIVEMNQPALDFLQIQEHGNLRASVRTIPQPLRVELVRKYEQVAKTGQPLEEEMEVALPGREPIWLQHKVVRVGNLVAVTASDITARKAADEAYRTLVNNSLQGLVIAQAQGVVFANPTAAAIVGLPAGQLSQLSVPQLFQFFHPDDREGVMHRLRQRFAGIAHSPFAQVRLIDTQGHLHWLDSYITPIQYRGQTAMQIAFLDITERKLTEEALGQSQQALLENQHLLQQISNTAPVAILVYDLLEQKFIFSNQYIADLTGHSLTTLQQIELSTLIQLVHPDDLPAFLARWQSVGQPTPFNEYRLKNRQGQWQWLQDRHVIFKKTTDGQPWQILIVAEDISERKEIEFALRDSEQHYRRLSATAGRQAQQLQLLERVSNVIATEMDMQQVFQVAGDSIIETFHYGRVDIMLIEEGQLVVKYQTDWDFEPGPDRDWQTGICGQVTHTGQPMLVKDVRLNPTYIGPTTIVSEICVPLLSQGNKIVGVFNVESNNYSLDEVDLEIILALAHQISIAIERSQLHARLQQQEKHFRALVENNNDSIILTNGQFQFIYASPSVTRLWGYVPEAFLQIQVADLAHPDEMPMITAFFEQLSQSPGQVLSLDHRVRHQNGNYRLVQTMGKNLLNEPSVGALVFNSRDVTELKQANEAMRRSQRLESLGVMAGSIAHDFNNLLTGLTAEVMLAMRKLPDPAGASPHLQRVLKIIERAADLTGQMLAYSGKGHFQMVSLSLNDFVRESLPLLQMTIPKMVDLQVSLAEGLPMIEADRGQMQQLLMNLVINGAEAHDERPGMVFIQTGLKHFPAGIPAGITNTALPPGTYVYLQVADRGKGMSREIVERIFDPFFTTKFTGRGLGLAAVLGIVKGHKGTIEVSSTLRQGTIFTIFLPVTTPVFSPPAVVVESRPVKLSHVLVIDDNEAIRQAIREILALDEVKTTLAKNGLEGVEAFQAAGGAFDLVLLDLTMPVLSGEETFIRLTQIRPNIPIVLMSGYSEEEASRRFTGLGLTGFLKKPFRVEQLMEKINQAVSLGKGSAQF